MLTVANVTKTYGRQVIFDDVSFTIGPGERVGLTGRNGTGKTTLLKLILGDEEPDSGEISTPRDYKIRYLSQHIRFTEDSILGEACRFLKVSGDGKDETYRVKSVLLGLGFMPDQFNRSPHILSGGYQVRLNLAKILVSEPNLLLLDEPTNYLDIVSVRWLTQFLRNWKNELVLVTHDRAFMDSITTHTMGIHRQKIRKVAGQTEKLYQQILQEEEVYEKTRVNDERKRREIEQFIRRFRAQATRAKAVQSRIRMLQKKEKTEKLMEAKNLDFQFRPAPFPGKWLMEVSGLSFGFSEEAPPLINGFSIAVRKHDRIGVIGKNGKGKTTLFNVLTGELMPTEGTIGYNQNLKLAYFGQMNVDRLDPNKTVLEEILSAQPEYNLGTARNICGTMMFEGDDALKRIAVLSGGERSRVLLGKLLVNPANMILLDEPDNHLDAESIDALIGAIDAFDGAVMIVTHSEMILNAVATRLVVLDGGEVSVFEGTYSDFLDRIGWEDERETAELAVVEDTKRQNKTAGRKDMRRMRAQIVADRSRILGPLQKRISELENSIIELENRVEQDNASLVRASRVGEGRTISSLHIAIYDAGKRIEHLFDELHETTSEYYRRSREFEEKLDDLQRTEYGNTFD